MEFKGKVEKIRKYTVKTNAGKTVPKYNITISGITYSNWGDGSGIEEGTEVSGEYDEKNGFNNIKDIEIVSNPQPVEDKPIQMQYKPIDDDINALIIRQVALKCVVELFKAPVLFDVLTSEIQIKKSVHKVIISYADMFTAWINGNLEYQSKDLETVIKEKQEQS